MTVSKLIVTAGVWTVYIFFPPYRYYALSVMVAHSVAQSIAHTRQQRALLKKV